MNLTQYIINDIKPVKTSDSIQDVQTIFNNLTYSHIPVKNEDIYIGCLSETDVHCFESDKIVQDYNYALEGYFVRESTAWLDILEAFAQNSTNIMPVLKDDNTYLGYYELNDMINLFNDTPFFAEPGGILIVEKGLSDHSFSEITQIVESNNGKLLGCFISKIENDVVQVTLKIGNTGLNDIIQTFRRYSYNIVSGHEEDSFSANLKERSEYLKKYLNI